MVTFTGYFLSMIKIIKRHVPYPKPNPSCYNSEGKIAEPSPPVFPILNRECTNFRIQLVTKSKEKRATANLFARV